MAKRNLISLEEHPDYPGVVRKAGIVKRQSYYDFGETIETKDGPVEFSKKIAMDVVVIHTKDGKPLKSLNRVVFMTCDETDYVNPETGEKVEADAEGNYPEGSILEYDYLWAIVYEQKQYTDIELEEAYIKLREDKLNQKTYE